MSNIWAYERSGETVDKYSFPEIGGCMARLSKIYVKDMIEYNLDRFEFVWNIYDNKGVFIGSYFPATDTLSLPIHVTDTKGHVMKGMDNKFEGNVENAVRLAFLKWEQKKLKKGSAPRNR
jgi:hypothetical protein